MSPVNCTVNIFRGLYMNDNLEVIIFFPYCKGFGFCLKKKILFTDCLSNTMYIWSTSQDEIHTL